MKLKLLIQEYYYFCFSNWRLCWCEIRRSVKKKDQIQGLAAGLEMNAAVIGLILLGRIVNPYFDILSPVILYSTTAIIFNSLPINGTDGCQILSVLLGVNIGALAKKHYRINGG